ncbi:MAG: hypothetical protein ACI4MJ_08690 [Aristaeellaceae bacterium]
MADKKPSLPRRMLRRMLTLLASALLLASFYIAVVLGQPQESDNTVHVDVHQALLSASPAVTIAEESRLAELTASFPVPVMYAVSGGNLTLVSGVSCDVAYEGSFARRMTLTYQRADGVQLLVESLYPARALSLMGKGDYHMAGVSGQPLAGMQSVRMENDNTIRLHAQSETGLYIVTAPQMDSSELAALTRSLQLTGNE